MSRLNDWIDRIITAKHPDNTYSLVLHIDGLNWNEVLQVMTQIQEEPPQWNPYKSPSK